MKLTNSIGLVMRYGTPLLTNYSTGFMYLAFMNDKLHLPEGVADEVLPTQRYVVDCILEE